MRLYLVQCDDPSDGYDYTNWVTIGVATTEDNAHNIINQRRNKNGLTNDNSRYDIEVIESDTYPMAR